MSKKTKLTLKQEKFCNEYIKCWNATVTYKNVYKVSQNSAEASWPRLLENVRVKERIAELREEVRKKAQLTREWMIENWKRLVEYWMDGIDEWKPRDVQTVKDSYKEMWKLGGLYVEKHEHKHTGKVSVQTLMYDEDSSDNTKQETEA